MLFTNYDIRMCVCTCTVHVVVFQSVPPVPVFMVRFPTEDLCWLKEEAAHFSVRQGEANNAALFGKDITIILAGTYQYAVD